MCLLKTNEVSLILYITASHLVNIALAFAVLCHCEEKKSSIDKERKTRKCTEAIMYEYIYVCV